MKDFSEKGFTRGLIDSIIKSLEKNCELIDSLDSYPISNYDTASKLLPVLKSSFEKVYQDKEDYPAQLRGFSLDLISNSNGFIGLAFGNFLYQFSPLTEKKEKITVGEFLDFFEKAFSGLNQNILNPKEESVLGTLKVINDSFKNIYNADLGIEELFVKTLDSLRAAFEAKSQDKAGSAVDAGSAAFITALEGIALYLELKTSFNSEFLKSNPAKSNIYNDTYCVSYELKGIQDIDALKKVLSEAGNDSFVNILPDNSSVRIHTHSHDPKIIFDRTSRFGRPFNIRILEPVSSPLTPSPQAEREG